MNYFIIEDQRDPRELIHKYIQEDFPQLHLAGFAENYTSAIKQIPTVQPNLLLLDINLGSHDGFELLDYLHNQGLYCPKLIIFITAYVDSDRILKAFEYYPLRYITKPIDRKKLQISIDQAIHQQNLMQSQVQDKIPIRGFHSNKLRVPKIKGEIELLDLDQILFLQSSHEGQLTKIYCTQHSNPIVSSRHLGYFKELLQEHPQFFTVSQSILVNLNYLKSYIHQSKTLILHNWQDPILASRRGGEDLKRWLCGG